VNAIQDAVILANCLYEIKPNPTHDNLVRALQTYRDERYSHVKTQHSSSQLSAKIQLGHVRVFILPYSLVFFHTYHFILTDEEGTYTNLVSLFFFLCMDAI
jgi:2-polyprenyl-6-methoxyphenol hydroxylase-like FAD-dependent oxidoreductase